MARCSFFAALLASLVIGVTLTKSASATDARPVLQEAINHFDQGEFDSAISILEQILADEPDNGTAAYELALTYDAKGDLASCTKTAKRYVRRLRKLPSQGSVLPQLSMLQASCYSKAGKTRKALKVFRSALRQNPDDYGLNFNIAITLIGEGDNLEAISHLQTAIMANPRQASAYYVIGIVYQDLGRNVESLLAFLTFLQREFDSTRTSSAAQAALEAAYSHVQFDASGNETTIFVDPDRDANSPDIVTLSITLSFAAALSAPDGKIEEPIAESIAGLLSQFIAIGAELEFEAEPDSFISSYLFPDIFGQQEAGVTNAFSYFVLSTAGIDGADDWLDGHEKEMSELYDYFEFLAYKGAPQELTNP